MSKQSDYLAAVELAKAGKYEQAQALLITIDHPKAELLLAKVNKAIAARGKQEASSGSVSNKGSTKATPKPSSKRKFITLGLLLVVLVGLGTWLYFGVYLPDKARAVEVGRAFTMRKICRTVFEDYYLENDISAEGFMDACAQEAEHAIQGSRVEIDYCLAQSQDGALENQMIQCLADNGFSFSGVWMSTAK